MRKWTLLKKRKACTKKMRSYGKMEFLRRALINVVKMDE